MFTALIYTEMNNCLMYIGPSLGLDNNCVLLCLVPMLTTGMVECRLFAYFSLMTSRLSIINRSIDFYRNKLSSTSDMDDANHKLNTEIFFITELVGSQKIKILPSNIVNPNNVPKKNFVKILKSWWSSLKRFHRNFQKLRQNKIFANDFEAVFDTKLMKSNYESRHYVEKVCGMQIIYTKIYEIQGELWQIKRS